MQLGPTTAMSPAASTSRRSSSLSPVSEKPDAWTTAEGEPIAHSPETASTARSAETATQLASGTPGRSATDGTQDTPSSDVRFGLTAQTSPEKPTARQ